MAPERILARLFGVRLVSDIYERLCELGVKPPLDGARKRRLAHIRETGVLFVHIPKNAGMSISMALYGRQIKHASMRYYAKVAPDLIRTVPSFAVVRDPVERFLSAYRYGKAGGSGDNRVSGAFRARYMAFRCPDDAMDHVESARSLYHIDHIFRPQSSYVTNRRGRVTVDRLFLLDELDRVVDLTPHGPVAVLPHLNESCPGETEMTADQVQRLRRLYPDDFRMFARLRGARDDAEQRLEPRQARSW